MLSVLKVMREPDLHKKPTGYITSSIHNLHNIVKKLFIYLYTEEQIKHVFTTPFVLFRSGLILRHQFVSAKVYLLLGHHIVEKIGLKLILK